MTRIGGGVNLVGWGIFLVILGAGSLLLPSIGFSFQLMKPVADFQPYAGAFAALVGAAMLVIGMTRRGRTPEDIPPA